MMAAEANYFENEYELDSELSDKLLTPCRSEISPLFHKKVCKFYKKKYKILTTCMKHDICHDNTVYTGSAGLAYHLFLVSNKKPTQDVELLKNALQYLEVEDCVGKRISFLCGDAGPLALAAVISHKLETRAPEDLPGYKIFTERLMGLIYYMKNASDELLYGKAGYLYALLFVNRHIGLETIPTSHIEKVVQAIINSGKKYAKQEKSESPLLWQWHNKIYLGAAHGMAGILYMLLQARSFITSKDLCKYIRPTVEWLSCQRYLSNNFPSHMHSPTDRLVQWCHGAPGFVAFWLLAAEAFGNERYIQIALDCGEVIWKRGITSKGYSLCHGVSGNAYAFVELYQATKQPIHLVRAYCFLDWCICENPGTEHQNPDRPASLFEGLLGRLHLAYELLEIGKAKFPAFTV